MPVKREHISAQTGIPTDSAIANRECTIANQTDHRSHRFPGQSIKLPLNRATTHHKRWLAHVPGQQVRFIGNGKDAFCRPGIDPARLKMERQVGHSRTIRRRKALVMTLTDERAIAAAAMAGESIQPKAG